MPLELDVGKFVGKLRCKSATISLSVAGLAEASGFSSASCCSVLASDRQA